MNQVFGGIEAWGIGRHVQKLHGNSGFECKQRGAHFLAVGRILIEHDGKAAGPVAVYVGGELGQIGGDREAVGFGYGAEKAFARVEFYAEQSIDALGFFPLSRSAAACF